MIHKRLQHPWLQPLLGHRMLAAALGLWVLSAVYWGVVASGRYVSEAHVIVQRTDLSAGQSMDLSGLLSGVGGGSRADELILRDHLLSLDMLKKLDAQLDLRSHYSGWTHDPISALWFKDTPAEKFYDYYLRRVSVDLDDYAGVLMVRAQAFDPATAHAITSLLVQEGEGFMNQLAHNLAQTQVQFLEQQLGHMQDRALQARQDLLRFQNQKGLAAPQAAAENLVSITAKLEAQRTELQTQRTALLAYLVPSHASVVMLDQQIAAIDKQLASERQRLASPKGNSLNSVVEEYQRLEMQAKFADDIYKTALVALEKGRIEATRTIKKVSVILAPTQPEYAQEPRRLYNSLVTLIVLLLLAGVAQLLLAVVRDHTD